MLLLKIPLGFESLIETYDISEKLDDEPLAM
jgi:hypothetical protein